MHWAALYVGGDKPASGSLTAEIPVIGVGEILNQATAAQSFSGNATPLMMGAIAYLILFVPVVALGRWLETRFAWRRA